MLPYLASYSASYKKHGKVIYLSNIFTTKPLVWLAIQIFLYCISSNKEEKLFYFLAAEKVWKKETGHLDKTMKIEKSDSCSKTSTILLFSHVENQPPYFSREFDRFPV